MGIQDTHPWPCGGGDVPHPDSQDVSPDLVRLGCWELLSAGLVGEVMQTWGTSPQKRRLRPHCSVSFLIWLLYICPGKLMNGSWSSFALRSSLSIPWTTNLTGPLRELLILASLPT